MDYREIFDPRFRMSSRRSAQRPTRLCPTNIFWHTWPFLVRWRSLTAVSVTSLLVTLVLFYGHLSISRQNGQIKETRADKSTDVNVMLVSPRASESTQTRPPTMFKDLVSQKSANSSSLPATFTETMAVQKERQDLLRRVCAETTEGQWTTRQLKYAIRASGTFYVDDRLRYIYCMVPKAACTTWTRVLLIASGHVRKKKPNDITQQEARRLRVSGRILHPLARYSLNEIEYRLKNYFKFLFVRHPLDRLSSAFKDRLRADHKMPKQLYNKRIIEKYRNWNETKRSARNSKLLDFYSKLGLYLSVVDAFDCSVSWLSYVPRTHPVLRLGVLLADLCLPCRIPYDFIGHHETLQADALAVLPQLGHGLAAKRVQFPTFDPDNLHRAAGEAKRINSSEKLRLKYLTVAAEDKLRLRTVVYARDFELFGYD